MLKLNFSIKSSESSSFRNHSNMMICCSRIISYYY